MTLQPACSPAQDIQAAGPGGAGRRRFVAPPRKEVAASCFDHPVYADMAAYRHWLAGPHWPAIAALSDALALGDKQLVQQDEALLADGLHYEQRIEAGRIATRADNWHDLFNALVWARYPELKRALNAAQCRHIAKIGHGERNRTQAALTQFDESGVIVQLRDATLLATWDAHDWHTLFVTRAAHWRDGRARVTVFGHALLEQALAAGMRLLGKCLVVVGQGDPLPTVADAVRNARVLHDPQQLRPLPLLGIPGWAAQQDAAFYADAGYFRPLREGRAYPPPLRLSGS